MDNLFECLWNGRIYELNGDGTHVDCILPGANGYSLLLSGKWWVNSFDVQWFRVPGVPKFEKELLGFRIGDATLEPIIDRDSRAEWIDFREFRFTTFANYKNAFRLYVVSETGYPEFKDQAEEWLSFLDEKYQQWSIKNTQLYPCKAVVARLHAVTRRSVVDAFMIDEDGHTASLIPASGEFGYSWCEKWEIWHKNRGTLDSFIQKWHDYNVVNDLVWLFEPVTTVSEPVSDALAKAVALPPTRFYTM